MKTVKMPDGKTYTFGPPPFSKSVVRCLELFAKDEKERTVKETAEMVVSLRAVMVDSLLRGGHNEDEAEAAICSIDFGGDAMAEQLSPIMEAVGIS